MEPEFANIESAVEAIEAIELGALCEQHAALAEALIERQRALDYLKLHPLSSVNEADREGLHERLSRVLQRDEQIMAQLREQQAQLRGKLDQVISGRALARSYGGLGGGQPAVGSGTKLVG